MLNELTDDINNKVIEHVRKFGPIDKHHVKIFVSRLVLIDLKKDIKRILCGYVEEEATTIYGFEIIEMKKDGYLIMIDSCGV